MKNDCKCQYCQSKVNEYFCSKCGLNFNRCESKYFFYYPQMGDLPQQPLATCPKCISEENMDFKNSQIGHYVKVDFLNEELKE